MTQEEENKKLRELLWIRHGCSFASLYGDDGEMQCCTCLLDFKRMPADEIQQRFQQIGMQKFSIQVNLNGNSSSGED